MIPKSIYGSFSNTSLKKLMLHRGWYEWAGYGGIIMNGVPTMLYLLFKSINPDISIGVSNLKD